MDIRMRGKSRLALTALLAVLLLLAGGCGKKKEIKPEAPKPPPKLSIQIQAADDANTGLPVVVRVYELKSPGAFNASNFFSLYDHESDVLGTDLLARDEVTLAPGQSVPVERKLDPSATYLGAVAAFRDIDHSHWREPLRLNQGVDNRILIEVGSQAVLIRHRFQ